MATFTKPDRVTALEHEVDSPSPYQEALYNPYLLTKQKKSVVPNGASLEFTNNTSGQAALPGVGGQQKTNPMVFF